MEEKTVKKNSTKVRANRSCLTGKRKINSKYMRALKLNRELELKGLTKKRDNNIYQKVSPARYEYR